MKNNKSNLIIMIVLGIILVISLIFIFSGLTEKEEQKPIDNNEVLETGISLSASSIKMEVGEEQEIVATVVPTNATYQNLSWEVGNTNIISLDNGKVKGLSPGTTFIKITTEKQKIARVINVTVVTNTIPITEIKAKEENIELYVGDSKKIEYEIVPSDATNTKISYSTDNKEVVGFNKEGLLVGVKEGTAIITLKSTNDIKTTINVTVKNKEVPQESKTKDKTAIFFGDSITMGKDGNYSWANYIGDHYDLKKTVNAGISGGVFSTFRGQYWIVDVVKKHKGEKYDYVIMHGGINDIALVSKFGEQKGSYSKTDFSGKYDTSTFLGGLETYIYTVKKQWPNAKIGFIINYRTPADKSVDKISSEYYALIREVCKKWDVKYINLYNGKTSKGEKYSDILKVTTDKYISDGTHLNRKGYNVISPYIYDWMKTL